MKYVYFIILLLFSILLVNINVESKTDSIIITNLNSSRFITPSLRYNNTYVYDNFEFRLYSDKNNNTYSIEVDNILIANGTIKNFNKIIYWKCQNSYINKISINIGIDYYNYSSIYVFTTSFANATPTQDNRIIMTQEEFDSYINDLKLKLFSADSIGWFIGLILAQIYVRQYKNTRVEEIE
jgi:hypothetical protein